MFGLHVFGNVGYRGRKWVLTPGKYDMLGNGNDSISSARPTVVHLYEHPGFAGKSLKITEDVPSLVPLDFNDIASSIEVSAGECVVYQDVNYGGRSATLNRGRYDIEDIAGMRGNDVISSVRLTPK